MRVNHPIDMAGDRVYLMGNGYAPTITVRNPAGDVVFPSGPTQWSWGLVAAIVYIAVGPSIIAYRLWGLAVAEAGPAMASIFYNLTPLFAAVLSAAVIGEGPQPFHGVAFGLIVAGIAVSSRSTAARAGK